MCRFIVNICNWVWASILTVVLWLNPTRLSNFEHIIRQCDKHWNKHIHTTLTHYSVAFFCVFFLLSLDSHNIIAKQQHSWNCQYQAVNAKTESESCLYYVRILTEGVFERNNVLKASARSGMCTDLYSSFSLFLVSCV